MTEFQRFMDLLTKYKFSTVELRKFVGFSKQNSRNNHGDLSTVCSSNINAEDLKQELNTLLEESKKWAVEINSYLIHESGLSLKILKRTLFKSVFLDVLNMKSGFRCSNLFIGKRFSIRCDECKSMTRLRMAKAADVISALIVMGGGTVSSEEQPPQASVETIRLSHAVSNKQSILVSPVKLPGATALSSEDDLTRLRTEAMRTISEHKDLDDESLNQVVIASIVFDLLSVKLNKTVCLELSAQPNSATRQSNSKGAPFVLYNYVRVHTILERYNYGIGKGTYPPLSSVEDIDCSLLSLEDEWSLLFDLIVEWPGILVDCQDISRPKLHRITGFLSALASLFSVYYRHTRVLTDGRPHMIPTMEARIHLLITIKEVFLIAFSILGIKPPHKM